MADQPKMRTGEYRPEPVIERLKRSIGSTMKRTGDISKDVGETAKELVHSQSEPMSISSKHKVISPDDEYPASEEVRKLHEGIENVQADQPRSWTYRAKQSLTRNMAPANVRVDRDDSGNVKGLSQSPMEMYKGPYSGKVKAQPASLNVPKMHDGTENVKGSMADKVMHWSQMYEGLKDFYKGAGKEAASVGQKKENVGEYQSATPKPAAPEPEKKDVPMLVKPGAKYGDKPGEKRPENLREGTKEVKDPKLESVMWGTRGMKMNMGVDTVPAMLTAGERVVKKSDNDKLGGMSNTHLVRSALAFNKIKPSDKESEEMPKPKKELKELRIRQSKNGGHIIEHHFTHPDAHQMEEHTAANMEDLHNHLHETFGIPHGDAAIQAADSSAQGGE